MGDVDNYGNCWNCLGQPLLVSDHWFAHWIQHGSGGKVNVKNLGTVCSQQFTKNHGRGGAFYGLQS
jgi:hypothetical protein